MISLLARAVLMVIAVLAVIGLIIVPFMVLMSSWIDFVERHIERLLGK